jgi:hypothetical protein
MFRTGIIDPQCGLKLFNRDVIIEISSMVRTNGFAFDSEMLIWASKLGYRIKEVPIIWNHQAGSKVLPPVQIVAMGKDLVSIWKRARKPQLVFPNTAPVQQIGSGIDLDNSSESSINLAEQRIKSHKF